ncbi:MAG: hypothetical protein ACPGN3_13455 [Opitutales bacterium]
MKFQDSSLSTLKQKLLGLIATGLFLGASAHLSAETRAPNPAVLQPVQNKLVLNAKYQSQTCSKDFVIVQYTVTESGTVKKPQVIATTKPVLNPQIVNEIEKWRFKKSKKGSTNVRQRLVFQ